jgi:hypothetical protein
MCSKADAVVDVVGMIEHVMEVPTMISYVVTCQFWCLTLLRTCTVL